MLLEKIGIDFGRFRERTIFRKSEGFGDLSFDFSLNLLSNWRVELRADDLDLVVAHPIVGLGPRTIANMIVLPGANMLHPSVSHTLEEERPGISGAQALDRLANALINCQRIVPFDTFGGHP